MTKAPLTPPALDPTSIDPRIGSGYPAPFRAPVAGRRKRALGDALGLTRYGVNLVELPPGAWSSQRHWHSHEDEFVYVIAGQLTLVNDTGEQVLDPGMVAGFAAGSGDGHHLINHGAVTARYLEIGDRHADDEVHYPDIDLLLPGARGARAFTHTDGRPYDQD